MCVCGVSFLLFVSCVCVRLFVSLCVEASLSLHEFFLSLSPVNSRVHVCLNFESVGTP